MDRINTASATPDHLFTEGSPTGGVPATVVSASWLNDLQEELINVITSAGLTPTEGLRTQVLSAIQSIASGRAGLLLPKRVFTINDYIRIPDVSGGLIIQWCGNAVADANKDVSFPMTFPTALLCAIPVDRNSAVVLGWDALNSTTSKIRINASTTNETFAYIAVGN